MANPPPPPPIGYHLKQENEKPTNPHTKLKPTYPQTHINLKAKPTNPRSLKMWVCGFLNFKLTNPRNKPTNPQDSRDPQTHVN